MNCLLPSVSWASSVSTNFLFLSLTGLMWESSSTWDLCCWERKDRNVKTWRRRNKWNVIKVCLKCTVIYSDQQERSWHVSTYAGWDHKWDLLVVESVHVICLIGRGGLRYLGGGGGVRFKATAPGSLWGSLENTRLEKHTARGHKGVLFLQLMSFLAGQGGHVFDLNCTNLQILKCFATDSLQKCQSCKIHFVWFGEKSHTIQFVQLLL